MAEYRKLGRTSSQRKALLRNQVTNLLYHGSITTTTTKAKEIRRIAEKLITLAIQEKDNYETVEVTVKVPRKDKNGNRVKEEKDGKKVTVYDEVTKTIKKDKPSRLAARRKMLAVFTPITEVPADGVKKRSLSKKVDLPAKMFDEIAPKYESRKGGYTRIVKVGPRKGDGAEVAIIELV
ncbi:MAG TPA: 50S ribosomal protein L17 [Lachnospiraceae bacterium]|jgi:large subunit ribosomal protein L17|nr:50S ribosomal protein L17 [Lachnospiraceae bacterium]